MQQRSVGRNRRRHVGEQIMSKLPPPVTKDSSKADLWEEIQALRAEIDSQQEHLNAATKMANQMRDEAVRYSYQLRIIREVLSLSWSKS
jgi:hypothetical protein